MSAMQRNARQIERWSPWLLLVALVVALLLLFGTYS